MFVIDEAMTAAGPLVNLGFEPVDIERSEEFDSGLLVLQRGDVRVRIVKDRGQWFAGIGSAAALSEWFDARLVLAEVGIGNVQQGVDLQSLHLLCKQVADTARQWEHLFFRTAISATRGSLRARELASARKRFGYIEDL